MSSPPYPALTRGVSPAAPAARTPEAIPMAQPSPTLIIRARVEAYDSENHTADVQPILGPSARISDLPVIESCPTSLIQTGDTVAVVLWPDGSGLVLGPYGGVP